MSGAEVAHGAGLEDVDNELMDGLVQTSFTVMTILSRVGAEHDLSLTQLRLLGILRDRQPKMAELAGRLGIDKSSVSGLVDRAERRHLVARSAGPGDRRSVVVSLTAAGHELAESVGDQVRAAVTELTAMLSPADRRRLSALLVRASDAQQQR